MRGSGRGGGSDGGDGDGSAGAGAGAVLVKYTRIDISRLWMNVPLVAMGHGGGQQRPGDAV